MMSRRSGRRIKTKKAPKSRRTAGHRSNVKTAGSHKKVATSPREQRRLVQLLVCGSLFVALVAVKVLLPGRLETVNQKLSQVLHQNMDVQAVFSAIGRTFSGETNGREVFQAVFGPEGQTIAVEYPTSMQITQEPEAAFHLLRSCQDIEMPKTAQEEQQEAVSTLAYIQYSNQNLPEHVSLEQAILNFEYCTPVCGTLTSGFGYREHPIDGEQKFHYGVDLAADQGTAIDCFADGTVTAVGESSSYGKYCIVDHGGGFETLYAHCSRITASSGADVHRGEKIGEVGATGIATGPHLHFELHREGVYLNPIYYVET